MPGPQIPSSQIPQRIPEDDHWWFASRTAAILALMRAVLPVRKGLAVLDVGCGAGNMIHHLRAFGAVKGVDVDPRPVEQARRRGYDVELADATERLPAAEGSYDLVTALDVIEHVEQDAAILREAHRVLKPGGHLVVTVPAFMWLWSHNDTLNRHRRRYTARDLRTRMQAVGLIARRISYNNAFIFPLAAPLIVLRRGHEPELVSHHEREDAYQVEMEPAPPLLNTLLTLVGRVEGALLRWVSLPFGTGLIAIGQKPEVA